MEENNRHGKESKLRVDCIQVENRLTFATVIEP